MTDTSETLMNEMKMASLCLLLPLVSIRLETPPILSSAGGGKWPFESPQYQGSWISSVRLLSVVFDSWGVSVLLPLWLLLSVKLFPSMLCERETSLEWTQTLWMSRRTKFFTSQHRRSENGRAVNKLVRKQKGGGEEKNTSEEKQVGGGKKWTKMNNKTNISYFCTKSRTATKLSVSLETGDGNSTTWKNFSDMPKRFRL